MNSKLLNGQKNTKFYSFYFQFELWNDINFDFKGSKKKFYLKNRRKEGL